MSRSIVIGKPSGSAAGGIFTLSAKISGAVEGECFYSLPEQYRSWVDEESSNCFLIGLLYTAMFEGCSLRLEGTVSEKLLFHTRAYLIPMLQGFFNGKLSGIDVGAASVTRAVYPEADRVGTGFTGGIDSFHTILNRGLAKDMPESARINTLFFFNVGGHGMSSDPARLKWLEEKFQARQKLLSAYPAEIGLPFIGINSNVHSFHRSGHLETSTLASLSAALFVGRRLRLYYLASAGFDYRTLFYNSDPQGYDVELIDDSTIPHITTETFSAIADGADASRPVKTRMVAEYEPASRFLNVCGNQETFDRNCSECFKCVRTMETLYILGLLDRFGAVFDLKKFTPKVRSRFAAQILNGRGSDLFFRDLYRFAEEHHFDLRKETTLLTRLYMLLSPTPFFLKLRSLKNRFLHRGAAAGKE